MSTNVAVAEAEPGSAALARVSAEGAAVVRLAEAWRLSPIELREAAAASPFALAARLLGVEPLLVERQPIRPIDGGRSFASNRAFTPLHTDSQMFLGATAAVQVLICVQSAPSGGASTLVDGTRVVHALEAADPALASALFAVDRVQRFYFGEVRGPTVALRGGHLAWTHAPMPADDIGRALAPVIEAQPTIEHTLRPGEALLASNHRMLHGRHPFEGDRELVRLLVWLDRPLAADASHVARARIVTPPLAPEAQVRIRAVLAILRGVPPARAAAEAQVPESTLYAWRDAFFRSPQ